MLETEPVDPYVRSNERGREFVDRQFAWIAIDGLFQPSYVGQAEAGLGGRGPFEVWGADNEAWS